MEPADLFLVRKTEEQEAKMKISDPTRQGREDLGGDLRDVSRAGNYDRPAREGRGDALLGDPNASPGDQDEATGRAKPNSTRAGRSLDYLDDRKRAGGAPSVRSAPAPGAPGHGRRTPRYENDEKIAEASRKASELDPPL
jgi:hypothetical protein